MYRALPAWIVPSLVRVLAWVKWQRRSTRTAALDQMRFVLGETASEVELDAVARAYVARSLWRTVSRWHPDLITHQDFEGAEHLQSVLASARGFLVCITHHGDWEGLWASLSPAGLSCRIVSTPDMFRDDAPEWLKQQRRVAEIGDSDLVDVRVGSSGVKQLVLDGHVVCIAMDIPGSTETRFLDKPLRLASGVARVALECDVPVLPLTSHRVPADPRGCGALKIHPALYPSDFSDAEELLQRLFGIHERAWLAWPEAIDDPLRLLKRDRVRRWKEPATAGDE